MSRGINFSLWSSPHQLLLSHVIVLMAITAILDVKAEVVLSMSHEIKAQIEPPEEIPQPQRPVITSSSTRHHVLIGNTVVFPCKVQNLGSNVLAWKKYPTHILFIESIQIDTDPSLSLLEHNSLKIRSVRPEHTGAYICQVMSSPPMDLTHLLEVLVPPKVTRVPSDGQVVAKKEDSVTLKCLAEGNPNPIITWSTAKGDLPRGISEKHGNTLKIPSADTYHSTQYQCKADNGIGDPATALFRVKVLYSPEVKVQPAWVHAGLGSPVDFSCRVSAEPPAKIYWTRFNSTTLQSDFDVIIHNTSDVSSRISIKKVSEEHFGSYKCTATNHLGSNYETVEVSGLAEPVQFRSNSTFGDDSSFLLLWNVKSYSRVIEYMLRIRKRKEDGIDEPPGQWTVVTIPVDTEQNVVYSHSYKITGLQPGTAYEAIIQARNEHGWNHPSETFIFYTNAGGQSEDVTEEYQAGLSEATALSDPIIKHLEEEEENQTRSKTSFEDRVQVEVKEGAAHHKAPDCMTVVLSLTMGLAVTLLL